MDTADNDMLLALQQEFEEFDMLDEDSNEQANVDEKGADDFVQYPVLEPVPTDTATIATFSKKLFRAVQSPEVRATCLISLASIKQCICCAGATASPCMYHAGV